MSFWHLTVWISTLLVCLLFICFLKYLTDSEDIRSLDTIYLLMASISNLLPRTFSEDQTWYIQLSPWHLHFGISQADQTCCFPKWTVVFPLQICSSTGFSQFGKWGLCCSVYHAGTHHTNHLLTSLIESITKSYWFYSKIYFTYVCFSLCPLLCLGPNQWLWPELLQLFSYCLSASTFLFCNPLSILQPQRSF